jgi:hypothetical protein
MLTKEQALKIVLELFKGSQVCENTRSRIRCDLDIYFKNEKTISLENLGNKLMTTIHASIMTSFEIQTILAREFNKLAKENV